MRTLGRLLVIGLVGLVGLASPALARVAAIRTTAPLADQSEQAVKAAFAEAVQAAVRGAMAMGLTRVALNEAVVLADAVFVEIVATDAEDESGDGDADAPAGARGVSPLSAAALERAR